MAVRINRDHRFQLKISSGFVMLLALLFWLDEGVGLLLPALLAAVLHEAGHAAAILWMGERVKGINLTAVGAEMELERAARFSYWKDAAVAFAGPLTSFLCAWAAFEWECYLLAGMCAGQGIFNLLPIGPLDGGRVLYAVIAGMADDTRAERAIFLTSALVVGTLFGIGLILIRQYGNPTLAITAGWLILGIFRRKRENNL